MNRGIAKRINRLTQKVRILDAEIKTKEDKKDTEEAKPEEENINDNNKR